VNRKVKKKREKIRGEKKLSGMRRKKMKREDGKRKEK